MTEEKITLSDTEILNMLGPFMATRLRNHQTVQTPAAKGFRVYCGRRGLGILRNYVGAVDSAEPGRSCVEGHPNSPKEGDIVMDLTPLGVAVLDRLSRLHTTSPEGE